MPALKNTKHELFCQEYLIDQSATKAAIRAGYATKSAHAQGYDLKQRPEVKERIAELAAERIAEVRENQLGVLNLYVTQAKTGMSSFLRFVEGADDPYIDLNQATPEQLDTLQEVTIETYIEPGDDGKAVKRIKIKAGDRLKAMEKLWQFTSLAKPHEDDKAGALASAIDQLARARGSAMPVGRQMPTAQEMDDVEDGNE